jgi:hypothetical protein
VFEPSTKQNKNKNHPKTKTKLQRINNPMNKWANELKRQFSKEEVQLTKKIIQVEGKE